MESTAEDLLSFFFHILGHIREMSLRMLTLIGFQKGEWGIVHSTCGFLLIGLAIHIAFDVALLTKHEINYILFLYHLPMATFIWTYMLDFT